MEFIELAKERFSVRAYKNAPVESEKLASILEAARLAPTACNNQPQKIYVAESEAARAALAQITPCTFAAPVVFVIGYDVSRSAKGLICDGYDFGDIDSSIVCTHMMMRATELGLGSCWVGCFSEAKVKAAFNIPENVRIRALLPIGYAADGAAPSPLHTTSRELSDMVETR